jgi:AcrR family transcriptional regulator
VQDERTRRKAGDTRRRILAIARELFASQGYTGTTIADIARSLGTTTAALYYHFKSKKDILDSLLAEPLAAYTRLCTDAGRRHLPARELLGAYLDFVADTAELIPLVSDPAVRSLLDDRLPLNPQEMNSAIISALSGSRPSKAATIRAHAALAVVKDSALAVLSTGNHRLSAPDRDEILAAALRALNIDAA